MKIKNNLNQINYKKGGNTKISNEELLSIREKIQKHEEGNLNGFEKIYPLDEYQ